MSDRFLSSELLRIPFDQYQRYRLSAEILLSFIKEGEEKFILDVGGYGGILRRFLSGFDIYVLDKEIEPLDFYIRGESYELPFKDKSFYAVIAIDLLEHIQPNKREQTLLELSRVSEELVIISSPFHYSLAREADKMVYEFIKEWLNYEHRFLKEHLEIPPCSLVDTESILIGEGFDTQIIPNGELQRWLVMMLVYYYLEGISNKAELKERLTEFYNKNYFFMDLAEPAYRHCIVASRTILGKNPKAIEHLLRGYNKKVEPDFEKLRSFLELARIGELKRMEGIIKELERTISERDFEIMHLKKYISELEDFSEKVRKSLVYRIYNFFKK